MGNLLQLDNGWFGLRLSDMDHDIEADGLPSPIHISDVIEVIDRDVESELRVDSSELRDAEEVVARDLATTEAAGHSATPGLTATPGHPATEPFGIAGVVATSVVAPSGTAEHFGLSGSPSQTTEPFGTPGSTAGVSGVIGSVATAIAVPTGATVSFGPGGCVVTGTDLAWQQGVPSGAAGGSGVSSWQQPDPSGGFGAVAGSSNARRRSSASNHPLLVAARGGGEGVVLGGTAIMNRHVICVITEQPASKALRFRYECEGRSAGSIPGISSTPENKTFPTIQIEGYKGRAVVVVSCVTKDSPYKPHPHSLVGKEGCKHGVCTMEVNTETMSLSFANLGIQCIKKKDIDNALNQREKLRIDPFKTGYEHKNQPGSIDLNAVRLCFQVFLEGKVKNQFNVAITPVVSEPIYDKKAMSDLVICKLSEDSAPVVGGKQIILLCEKVAKEDISVRLFEEVNNQTVWEGQCDFQTTDVHKQVAITFRTPRYRNIDVTDPILVQIQLVRPSDKAASEPLPFQLTPIQSAPSIGMRRKRAKYDVVQELEATNAKLLQCDGTLVKQEDQQAGGYWKASPVYGGAPSPAGAPGASPDYTNLATGMAGPSTAAYGGLVYAPPPAFSPAGSVASPAEHQASVSPLPQMGHPLDQMNNLSMIQQQVNIDNNLNIIQPQHNIVQQHSPMQHNIMQQNSPISNIVDNMMQQQHSPMSNIVDNMIQQQQQHSPMSNIVDNIIQQHSPLQQHNNMSQQPTQGSMCQQVVDSMQQQNNICQQVNIAQQQSNMCQQVDNMAQQGSMCQQHVVMDMDTQQHSIELSAGRLDSRDLRDLDLDSVSENLSANLILNEVAGTSESMTDSLGRIPSNSLLYYNQSNGNGFPSQGGSSNML